MATSDKPKVKVNGTEYGWPRKPLVVVRPSEAELADHDRVLAAIDKETKGGCLWLPKAPEDAPAA